MSPYITGNSHTKKPFFNISSSFLICEGGILALTATALHYKPPGAKIKWSLALETIDDDLKREASGYLSSGKIHFSISKSKKESDKNVEKSMIWNCQVCEEVNESVSKAAAKCKICGSLQKGALLEVKIDEPIETKTISHPIWKCEVCEETNTGDRKNCSTCGFSKSKTEILEMENWPCPSCTFVNLFPRGTELDSCQVCDAKPATATETANKIVATRYKLSFRSGGSTNFYNKLIQTRSEAQKKLKFNQKREEEAVVVGISGLLRRQEERNLAAEASLSSAFLDLDALMRSAGEMVQLAAKISEKMAKSAKNSSTDDNLSVGERNTFNDLIETLGIETSAHDVDENISGTLEFYRSIAHGVSGLVQTMISKTGTRVYSLADVYCLYNRTRTSGSLIAPADLLKATRQLSRLALPIRLHKFTEKGMLCLVPAQDVDPHHLYLLIQQILKEKGTFLTAVDLAEKLKISLFLAGQQLQMAESAGKIVRDAKRKDLPAFYPNFIISHG